MFIYRQNTHTHIYACFKLIIYNLNIKKTFFINFYNFKILIQPICLIKQERKMGRKKISIKKIKDERNKQVN